MSKTPVDNSTIHRRAFVVTIFLALTFGVLSARIIYVQVAQHDTYAEKARNERLVVEVIPAKRGRIFDRHGEALVGNRLVRNIIVDRNHLEFLDYCRRAVAKAEGIPLREVAGRFDDAEVRRRTVAMAVETLSEFIGEEADSLFELTEAGSTKVRAVLSRGLPFDKAEQIRGALAQRGLRGFSFEDASERIYLNPGRLTQVSGFINAEGVGKGGLEKELDNYFAGEPGYRKLERARRSSELLSEHSEEVPAKHGADVHLTIDMGLQCIVERHLEAAVEKYSPEKITAVFMDPMTGEILAMASRPHFDQETLEGVRKVVPVTDRFEPGSTFKIVALAAGFDQGLIEPESMFFCYNGFYEDGPIKLHDHSPYAYLTTNGIMAKSSNIGAYLIAKQVGAESMHDYVTNFGFGARTGVALPSEAAGQVARPGSSWWSKTSLSRLAMGYEVDATALQIVNAYCAIANGGTLMKPRIIHTVTAGAGKMLHTSSPQKIRRVISEEAANKVRKALMGVVAEGGTGTKAAVDGFLVAGKTGTARKPKEDRSKGYYRSRYVVSFAGFLPAENPRLAGIIIVDDPQRSGGSIYGGAVAAPIFSAIAAEAMPHLGVSPSIVPRRAARALPRTAVTETESYLD